MEYRRVGSSGLKVSVLSFGSWVTFSAQLNDDLALDCMQTAYDAGVNFFDNAEAYAGGESEAIMGRAIKRLGWERDAYVVSSKFFWGLHDGPNRRNTLNRKYLLPAIEASVERMGLEYLDIIYCHRADPETPIEETVWAMHDAIERGYALYWGTSEWTATEIAEAYAVADRLRLRRPIVEQPQYNLLTRERVEVEYAPLYDSVGLGLTIWSPLASGVLTGKYLDGIPADSRGTLPGYEWLRSHLEDEADAARVRRLMVIAAELGCTVSQLSIAWCAKNPHVSTVITGASKVSQVRENMQALDVIALLTDDVMARIEAAVA
jgi:voltage-dependent potassium channel beta subunit